MEYCWIWMYFTGMLLGFWSLFSKLSSHCIWTCCRPTWPTTTHTILFLLTARPKIQQTVIFLVLAVVWHLYFICSLEQFVSRSRPVSYTHHWSQWKTHNGNRSSHPRGAVQVWLCQFSSSSRGCRLSSKHPSTVRTFQEGRRVRTGFHHTSGHFCGYRGCFSILRLFYCSIFTWWNLDWWLPALNSKNNTWWTVCSPTLGSVCLVLAGFFPWQMDNSPAPSGVVSTADFERWGPGEERIGSPQEGVRAKQRG